MMKVETFYISGYFVSAKINSAKCFWDIKSAKIHFAKFAFSKPSIRINLFHNN